ncbi:chorismate--pyruvate lyase family protein [Nocardia sp. GCM10030253]|uniref:chorismate--pyruvate lyase family protein n=1 Tax=Nocardia sp. GCM10030253 TaxID=3273404 RepID=UPI0036421891
MLTDVAAEALVRRHFHAPFARPPGWQDIAAAELSPYHRAVLLTDGTVTRTLEAHVLEPVEAQCVAQRETTAAADRDGWLDVPPEEKVLVREVDLIGARTGTRYARAESLIALGRLPAAFSDALATESAGIGAALQTTSSESYRQLLFYGRTSDAVCARCYRIYINRRPALVIREWFLR